MNREPSTVFINKQSQMVNFLNSHGTQSPSQNVVQVKNLSRRTGAACLKPSLQHEPWRACYAADRNLAGNPLTELKGLENLQQFWPFLLNAYMVIIYNVYTILLLYVIYLNWCARCLKLQQDVHFSFKLETGVKVDSKLLKRIPIHQSIPRFFVHLLTTFSLGQKTIPPAVRFR